MMTKTGMLVVTNPKKFVRLIPRIQKEIKSTLYIQFFPEKRLRTPEPKSVKFVQIHPPFFSPSVINFYSETIYCNHLDVRVLLSSIRDPELYKITTKSPVEVVYFDQLLNQDQMRGFVMSCVQNRTPNCELIALDDDLEQDQFDLGTKTNNSDLYDNVVLGGTFDRLHAGHKILLSEAVIRCNKKLTVGITNTAMIRTKKLWELIEPCEVRIQNVREFLEDIEPNLDYNIVEISDMYGPTKSDPSFEMLIVSAETVGGGSKVNELRLTNGLKPLAIHSVELVNDIKLDDEEEDKISSSNCRLRLLGTRIREPEHSPNLPAAPYVIGLTGGIASGKSSIAQRLQNLGAGIINCDSIAHQLYNKGQPAHISIINQFGDSVIASDGHIDRNALGKIVFNNKEQLNKLNDLLWSAILERTKQLTLEFYKKGYKVVVVEAAVLIQAGWNMHFHEVWACIIPPEEAIRRMKERTGLTDEEAKLRITSQPSNLEQVSNAHLVFCTLWRPEYTQKQVERAWKGLMERLNSV